jgi:hypothetical protein
MNSIVIFWIVFTALLLLLVYLAARYELLNDTSKLKEKKPYSYARTQLAWWTLIVLSSFISILLTGSHKIPVFDQSTLILLGITAGTLATAGIADASAQKQNAATPEIVLQNQPSEDFLRDILSDGTGISVHRLQSFIFNIVFGCWFITEVLKHLGDVDRDHIIPIVDGNNLILLGLSAGTYIALKAGENKH